MSRITSVVGVGIAVATSTLLLSAPAHADSDWNAIAYSVATGAHGYAYSPSHDKAESLALGYCSRDGASDCEIAATSDTGCLAAAVDGNHLVGGLGPTEEAAKNDAVRGGGSAVLSWCP